MREFADSPAFPIASQTSSRSDTRSGIVRVALTLAVAVALGACGEGSRESGSSAPTDGSVKKYGTIDPSDFAHPKINRAGAITIEGCCTFDPAAAKVTKLQSDAQIRVIEGPGYRAEISFGFADGSSFLINRSIAQRTIDGVVLRSMTAARGRGRTWVAEVPVTAKAATRGVVRPKLRVEGKCEYTESCRTLDAIIATMRF